MILTKSICKCRKTWDICCTTFCAEACSVAVKVTNIEKVDGSEKMTDKIYHLKNVISDCSLLCLP